MKLGILFTLIFSSLTTFADMLIEPYLGYEIGISKSTFRASTLPNDGAVNGTVIGARLGYKFPALVWLALDPQLMTGNYKATSSGFTDASSSRQMYFLDVGVDFPILLRLWAGYGFSNTWNRDEVGGNAKFTGSATKFGLSLTSLPFVTINAEYIMHNFDKVESGNTILYPNSSTNSVFSTWENSSVILSVGFPIEI